jgi:hypothetical protein
MHKNVVIYKDALDFRKREGIVLPSTKEQYIQKLKAFEGMKVGRATLDHYINTNPEYGEIVDEERYLFLDFYITRRIEGKTFPEYSDYKEEEVNSETSYSFRFVRSWKLYFNDELVYDTENLSQYKSPRNYIKDLNDATLLDADIDKDWDSATFVFDTGLKLIAINDPKSRHKRPFFFTIIKQSEPFVQHLDFGTPEKIYYANEVVQQKVTDRKKHPKFVV